MAKTIYGRVVDSSNKPVEFATVYVSDKDGKFVQPSRTAETDSNGRFSLKNVNDTDYVTVTFVGFDKKTLSVKDAVQLPTPMGVMPTLLFKMTTGKSSELAEVEVTTTPFIPKKKKKDYTGWYILGIGLLVLAGAVIMSQDKKLKTAKI